MIKGVHTMFYSSEPEAFRQFVRDKLDFPYSDVGDGWWHSPATGEFLRELFREGTRPLSEEIAGRLGFDPLDVGPLVAELSAAG